MRVKIILKIITKLKKIKLFLKKWIIYNWTDQLMGCPKISKITSHCFHFRHMCHAATSTCLLRCVVNSFSPISTLHGGLRPLKLKATLPSSSLHLCRKCFFFYFLILNLGRIWKLLFKIVLCQLCHVKNQKDGSRWTKKEKKNMFHHKNDKWIEPISKLFSIIVLYSL